MFGSKTREIADLRRALRLRTAERDAIRDDYRALRADVREVALVNFDDATKTAERLARALRACARYRSNEARLAARLATVQSSYDHAVGLDHPDVTAGARWQETRQDRWKDVVR